MPRALRIAVSAALVGHALSSIDLDEAWRLVSGLRWAAAIGAITALLIKLAAGAQRWLVVLRRLGAGLDRRQGLAIVCLGNFFNQLLPSSVGGWAARVWLARRAGCDMGVAARSVVLDLVAGFVALALMLLGATPWLWRWTEGTETAATVLSASLTALALFAILLFPGYRAARSAHRLLRAAQTTSRDARRIFLHAGTAAHTMLLSFLFQSAQVLAIYALARGLGVDLSLLEAFVLVPVVLAAMTLPISVGGWGVREVGLITSLGLAGVPAEAAAVVGVLFGLFNLGLGLLSGAGWLVLRRSDGGEVLHEATRVLGGRGSER